MIGPDRIRDEDFAELCRQERGDPPPKPAEPQNRIEYGGRMYSAKTPEEFARLEVKIDRRRRRLAYVALTLPFLFAAVALVAIVLIQLWG